MYDEVVCINTILVAVRTKGCLKDYIFVAVVSNNDILITTARANRKLSTGICVKFADRRFVDTDLVVRCNCRGRTWVVTGGGAWWRLVERTPCLVCIT